MYFVFETIITNEVTLTKCETGESRIRNLWMVLRNRRCKPSPETEKPMFSGRSRRTTFRTDRQVPTFDHLHCCFCFYRWRPIQTGDCCLDDATKCTRTKNVTWAKTDRREEVSPSLTRLIIKEGETDGWMVKYRALQYLDVLPRWRCRAALQGPGSCTSVHLD